jgi:hypothetical protein
MRWAKPSRLLTDSLPYRLPDFPHYISNGCSYRRSYRCTHRYSDRSTHFYALRYAHQCTECRAHRPHLGTNGLGTRGYCGLNIIANFESLQNRAANNTGGSNSDCLHHNTPVVAASFRVDAAATITSIR